ncbi:hypothetical protein L1987_13719 [Smallanthus sonchifolius]|uniref:Uncharacterized protein n=1 Tax=Smallanthus sonchifolius TaxID=185202 RepID=A0ACB9JKS2_9ASTR|nr:hypothetical protein L1987_13719 [Smallanthus sonchifolius]
MRLWRLKVAGDEGCQRWELDLSDSLPIYLYVRPASLIIRRLLLQSLDCWLDKGAQSSLLQKKSKVGCRYKT